MLCKVCSQSEVLYWADRVEWNVQSRSRRAETLSCFISTQVTLNFSTSTASCICCLSLAPPSAHTSNHCAAPLTRGKYIVIYKNIYIKTYQIIYFHRWKISTYIYAYKTFIRIMFICSKLIYCKCLQVYLVFMSSLVSVLWWAGRRGLVHCVLF